MKIKSKNNTVSNTNFKAFNVTFVETNGGLQAVGVFGANSVDAPDENWQRLNSRSFSRQLKSSKLVTR